MSLRIRVRIEEPFGWTKTIAGGRELRYIGNTDAVVPSTIGDRRIDLMKVDTESTEPEVLEGCSSLLAEHRPVVFCEVLRGRTEEGLQSIVDRLDCRTWWLSDDGPVSMPRIEGQRGAVTWLFLPDDGVPLSVGA